MKLNQKAQQFIEYLLLIAAVAIGVLALAQTNGTMHQAVEGTLKRAVDTIYQSYTWRMGQATPCSCDTGTQTRLVWCQKDDGSTVADSFCLANAAKPPETLHCNAGGCGQTPGFCPGGINGAPGARCTVGTVAEGLSSPGGCDNLGNCSATCQSGQLVFDNRCSAYANCTFKTDGPVGTQCSVGAMDHGAQLDGHCDQSGSCKASCFNGEVTFINQCTSAADCPGGSEGNPGVACTVGAVPNGQTADGNCDQLGHCQATCNNGRLTFTKNCFLFQDCAGRTDGSSGRLCTVSAMKHGDNPSGRCDQRGSCSASCYNGQLTFNNTCTPYVDCVLSFDGDVGSRCTTQAMIFGATSVPGRCDQDGSCTASCDNDTGRPTFNNQCSPYQCSGTPPQHASQQCPDTTTGLSAPTTWKAGDCSGKCQARCDTGYYNNNGVCALAICTNFPSSAIQCPATQTTNLPANTPWTLVNSASACGGAPCQAYCSPPLYNISGSCAQYSCPSGQPASSTACPGSTSNLTQAVTSWSLVSGSGNCTGAKCQAYCAPPLYNINGVCAPYQCSGNQPTGSQQCPNTITNLTQPTSWSLVAGAGGCTSTKCQAYYQCSGNQPAGSLLCPSTTTGLSGPTSWRVVTGAGSCTSGKCEAYYQCSGNQPGGSFQCSNTMVGLSIATSWHSVGSCTGGKCEYYYQCSGTQPSGSTQCSGTTTGLTGPTSWSLVSSCSGKCQAICSSPLLPYLGNCVTPKSCNIDIGGVCSGTRLSTTTQPSETACVAVCQSYPNVGCCTFHRGTHQCVVALGSSTASCGRCTTYQCH